MRAWLDERAETSWVSSALAGVESFRALARRAIEAVTRLHPVLDSQPRLGAKGYRFLRPGSDAIIPRPESSATAPENTSATSWGPKWVSAVPASTTGDAASHAEQEDHRPAPQQVPRVLDRPDQAGPQGKVETDQRPQRDKARSHLQERRARLGGNLRDGFQRRQSTWLPLAGFPHQADDDCP